MATLVVCAISKVNDDPYMDAKCYKAGDVIDVLDDGASVGTVVALDPRFRTLRVADLSVSEARSLLAAERDTDPKHPSRMLQRRAFALDLSQLPSAPTAADIRAAKRPKPLLPDPAIIG